jgi:hypothetical protein
MLPTIMKISKLTATIANRVLSRNVNYELRGDSFRFMQLFQTNLQH